MFIEVTNLSKKYKDQTAVHPLTFSIRKGSCVAILGPNGAGKTTTLQMLAGLLTKTTGDISFNESTKRDIRSRIGFLPQYPSFFNWMTASEFLQLSGQLANMNKDRLKSRMNEVLEFVGLSNEKKKRIASFSGGMKQRLGLAQAILHEPDLLILDEPVSALDPQGRRDVLHLIQTLKSEMTILFSTHILHDAEQICDNIIILKEGKVKWNGPLDELQHDDESVVLKLTIDGQIKEYLTLFSDHQYELLDQSTALVYVNSKRVGGTILAAFINEKVLVTHYELIRETLEDAYLKVVDQ